MSEIIKIKDRLLKSSLFKDSFWALTGSVLGKGLALTASIVVARLLGKDLFGMYGLIRTTLLSVAVFSTFGLGYTATKFIAEYTKKAPEKIKSIISDITQITLVTGTLFGVLIFIFANQLASYLDSVELSDSIKYLAVIVIFNSITTTQTGVLAGFKKFKQLARINLINGLIVFCLSVILTYFYSLDGALMALLIAQMYNCLQNYIEVRHSVRDMGVQHDKVSIKKELTMFSLPVAMQEMIYSISNWILPILLVKFSNFGEVGIYNAATQWSAVILFIPGILQNVFFSHLSSVNDNLTAQNNIVKQMLLINLVATFIPCLLVWEFSSIITQFYGSSFDSLHSILNISVFTTVFSCLNLVFLQYLVSNNQVWYSFILRFIRDIMIVFVFLFFVAINIFQSVVFDLVFATLLIQVLFLLYLSVKHIINKIKNVKSN